MAVIRLSGQASTFFDFQPLMMDEFIPVVEFNRGSFNNDYGYLSGDPNETTLSEHIDEKLRKIQPKVVETEARKIKLPFSIQKGCDNSKDTDGIIEIKLSVSDPDITIGNRQIKAKYGEDFVLELDIKKKSDVEFYIDFFANDNDDNNVGELKDIHCGKIKVQFAYRSEIVIIVGTDAAKGEEHSHQRIDNFIRRVDRLLNISTIENINTKTDDYIFVIVPPDMPQENILKLKTYGSRFSHYQVKVENALGLTLFVNGLSNIRNFIFFGHGINAGPLYNYGVERLPMPNAFKKKCFSPDAQAIFATCNSKDYAKNFTAALGIDSIGVEGTTFYGTEEISAGKLNKASDPGTSIAWRYETSVSGIKSSSYSLNQQNGQPFLKKK